MAIKLRKQPTSSVEIPSDVYVQLFVDQDGAVQLKYANGATVPVTQSEILTLIDQTSDPAPASSIVKVYSKNVGGTSEVFALDSDGNISQLTADGDSLASGLQTATTVVSIGDSSAPTAGQVLTATGAVSATWQNPTGGGAADSLATTGADVTVSSAAPPSTGQVLTATSPTNAIWQNPTGGTTAEALGTTGADVGVGAATPPSTGQALIATSATTATWQAINVSVTSQVSGLGTGVAAFLATPSSTNLRAALTDETGTGALVFATSPVLVTPNLGTPSAATLTSATGLPISTGVSGLGTGVAAFLAAPSSANLATALTDETGTGANVFATSPSLVTPNLGTPSVATLTNATGLPISTGVAGLGAGVAAFLATPSSANLITALTDETGTGSLVFATSPTLVTPLLGTPTSGVLTNCTGRVNANQTADQIATSGTAVTISSTAPSTGQVLTASSSTAANWQTPSGGSGSVASELFAFPASPHADDTEFTGSLPVGWDFYGSAGLVVSSSTALDPYTVFNSGNPKVKYQSNDAEHPSWLRAQYCSDGNVYLGARQLTTVGTNMAIWTRFRNTFNSLTSTTNNNEGSVFLALWANNAGVPHEGQNSIQIGFDVNPAESPNILFSKVEAGTPTTIVFPVTSSVAFEYVMLHKRSTTYHAWAYTSDGRAYYVGSQSFSPTVVWGGFRFGSYTANALPGNAIVGADFFRRVDSATFSPI